MTLDQMIRELRDELEKCRNAKKVMYGELLAVISGAGIATPEEGYEAAPWFLVADIRKIVEELKTARARLMTRPRLHPNSDALDPPERKNSLLYVSCIRKCGRDTCKDDGICPTCWAKEHDVVSGHELENIDQKRHP